MVKLKEEVWSVLPHDEKLTQLEENIWTIEGTIPVVPMPRRMVVVRLQDGGLLLHNAIALNEAGMAALEKLGDISWMVIPNGYHRIDAARFKARFPDLKIICPKGAVKRILKMVPVDMNFDEANAAFRTKETVSFIHLKGVQQMEGVMKANSNNGVTLVMNDSIFNLDHMKGLFGLIYGRLMGHTGHIQIPNVFRWVFLKNKKIFKEHLLELADEKNLIRVIPGHGKLIEEHSSATLLELSETI